MEKNRLIFNSPTTEELKVLKHFLPGIKAKAEGAATPQVQAQRQMLRGYCGICGEGLKQSNRSRDNKNLCKGCHGNLKSGQTALVTMDGRYAFGKFDGSDEVKHLVGKIIPIAAKDLTDLATAQGFEIHDVKNN